MGTKRRVKININEMMQEGVLYILDSILLGKESTQLFATTRKQRSRVWLFFCPSALLLGCVNTSASLSR